MPIDDSLNPKGNIAEKRRLDKMSKLVLFNGATLSQLALMFGMDHRTASKKLQPCESVGMRFGVPIYRVRDAAPYLVTPIGDFESYIKNMSHKDLPPSLTKEYWGALLARQKFEEEQGDLWRSDFVVQKFSEVFQKLRVALLLMSDGVEREVEFTDRQRSILKDFIDTALEECRVSLVESFASDEADDEHESDTSRADEEPDDEPGDEDDEAYWATEEDDEDHGL